MSEIWLHNNRRLLLPLSIPAGLLALAGAACCLLSFWSWPVLLSVGVALLALAVVYVAAAWGYLRQPRLAYRDGHLIVYVGQGRKQWVPIEVVEVFFMGQAESKVHGPQGSQARTATVVVRLAEKATQWQSQDMASHLGKWADSYIIVDGTWCETIDMPLLDRLNKVLAAAHREQRQQAQAKT